MMTQEGHGLPPLMGREIVFIDTETTGLSTRAHIWEIALIGRDRSYHAFVDFDMSTGEINSIALSIGGFHERHPDGDKAGRHRDLPVASPFAVIDVCKDMLNNVHLVGVNVAFDVSMVTALFEKWQQEVTFNYHAFDLEAASIIFIDQTKPKRMPKSWSSTDLSLACGVKPPAKSVKHTAQADALWALRWYKAIRASALSVDVQPEPASDDDSSTPETPEQSAPASKVAESKAVDAAEGVSAS